jgi:hypothetical protein
MPVHFANLPEHRYIVLKLYRALVRNTLHLPATSIASINSDIDLPVEILNKVRCSFRNAQRSANSLLVQTQLHRALDFNNALIRVYEGDLSELLKLLPAKCKPKPKTREEERIPQQVVVERAKNENSISNKVRKNPAYSNLSNEEIAEFRNTRHFSLPKDTECILPNIKIHARWYFQSHDYPLLKSEMRLGKQYMKYILPSLITHGKQRYALDKLETKLSNPPSHKLRRISGTGNWLYLINTPWNRDLRTEDFRFIGDTRKAYDELVLKLQSCEAYRRRYENLAHEEARWEQLISGGKGKKNIIAEDWLWACETAEKLFHSEKMEIESSVVQFNKRQGVIYSKIKPEFDAMHQHAVENMKLMQQDIKTLQLGPYTDISDGGLGSLFKKYGFRDPMRKFK